MFLREIQLINSKVMKIGKILFRALPFQYLTLKELLTFCFRVLFTIRRYCYFVFFISKEIILCSITYYHVHNKYLQRIYSTIIFK